MRVSAVSHLGKGLARLRGAGPARSLQGRMRSAAGLLRLETALEEFVDQQFDMLALDLHHAVLETAASAAAPLQRAGQLLSASPASGRPLMVVTVLPPRPWSRGARARSRRRQAPARRCRRLWVAGSPGNAGRHPWNTPARRGRTGTLLTTGRFPRMASTGQVNNDGRREPTATPSGRGCAGAAWGPPERSRNLAALRANAKSENAPLIGEMATSAAQASRYRRNACRESGQYGRLRASSSASSGRMKRASEISSACRRRAHRRRRKTPRTRAGCPVRRRRSGHVRAEPRRDSQLFLQFAGGGVGVGLAGLDHAAGGGSQYPDRPPCSGSGAAQRSPAELDSRMKVPRPISPRSRSSARGRPPSGRSCSSTQAMSSASEAAVGHLFGADRRGHGSAWESSWRRSITAALAREIVGHHQRVVGQDAVAAAVQHHRAPQRLLRGLQLADDLPHADRGVLLRQHVGEVDLDGAQQCDSAQAWPRAS